MKYDVIIIGGGAAGMASAIESSKLGAKTLLIEKDGKLGGILNQCIHNGFGLKFFKEELTGPEYAHAFETEVKENNIEVMLNTFVLNVENGRNEKSVTIINEKGMQTLQTKSIVLAMGCREKTAGSINLAGVRPAGIFTAGQVQYMVNIAGKMPGKKVVILGSGDIGLIMARRLTFEGAKVEKVIEIMPTTSGLARNVQQCLVDFNIPLLFNTTITKVVGKNRVEGIYYANVDENFKVLPETEKFLECDCILLSVGLIPDNSIIPQLNLHSITNGAVVDEYRETEIEGIFACGNVLHVHDLVDNVTEEAIITGKNAALFAQKKLVRGEAFKVTPSTGVRYVLPNTVYNGEGKVEVFFRASSKFIRHNILAKCKGESIAKKFVLSITPGEMQTLKIDKSKITGDIEILIEKTN